jgi:hypothetical protein
MKHTIDYEGMWLVAERYEKIAGINAEERITTLMDLEIVEQNFGPVDWDFVANMSAADFSHDLFGVKRHINRQTHQIEGCFVPRFVGNFPK